MACTRFIAVKSDAINLHLVKTRFSLREGLREWWEKFSLDAMLVVKMLKEYVINLFAKYSSKFVFF